MKNHRRKALSFLLIISLFIGMVGIVNVDTTYAASKKIHLKKTKITMLTGKTYQQKLIDKKGKTIKATKVKWKSLKTSVAKINKKGKITALKAGTAKMTAKYKGKTYKFTVKVKGHNGSVSVDPAAVDVLIGQRATVIVKTDKGESVFFSTNNDNVECEWGDWIDDTNDSYFYIDGVKKGYSYITIYDTNDKIVKCTIHVTIKESTNTTISVEPATATMEVGERKTFVVKTDAGEAISFDQNNDNVECEWGDWIDDTNDSYFYVEAVKPGTSVITIYDDADQSVKATIDITVEKPGNTSISFDPASLSVVRGYSNTVNVVTDNGAEMTVSANNSNISCEWGAWNNNKRELKITGNAAGTAVVTVTDAKNNTVQAQLNVTVVTPLQVLQAYIYKNGTTNSSGRKECKFTLNSQNTVSLEYRSDNVGFIHTFTTVSSGKTITTTTAMALYLPERTSNYCSVEIDLSATEMIIMSADVDIPTYNPNSTVLTFEKLAGTLPYDASLQDTCNASYKLAMNCYNITLQQLLGFTLKDMGYTSY